MKEAAVSRGRALAEAPSTGRPESAERVDDYVWIKTRVGPERLQGAEIERNLPFGWSVSTNERENLGVLLHLRDLAIDQPDAYRDLVPKIFEQVAAHPDWKLTGIQYDAETHEVYIPAFDARVLP